MPATRRSPIPADSLLALRQRLDRLPPKSPERSAQVEAIAELYGVSSDGVGYQEYRCVYGEDAESALRFLFNAMAPKPYLPEFPFQGIPGMLYMDNGPVAKSRVFQHVMEALGVVWQTHLPAGKDGRRVTARSKGKVERPFRTVKEMHETLYHFHRPQNEAEANLWLQRYLLNYNRQPHRSEPHSRLDDGLANLPAEGFREMCSWEQFCRFAREPERRKVGADARISVAGTAYEVDPGLAGETVLLLWGLFDNELYVEYDGERSGPYVPIAGPTPLNRYRTFKKTAIDEKADRIRQLANQLGLPIAALTGELDIQLTELTRSAETLPRQPFPSELQEDRFSTPIAAKLAIADDLALPLAQLAPEDRAFIDQVLADTLVRQVVLARVRAYFRNQKPQGEHHAG